MRIWSRMIGALGARHANGGCGGILSIQFVAAALVLGLAISAPSQSQAQGMDWSPYVSDQNPDGHICKGAIGGMRCDGTYCYNHSLGCLQGSAGTQATDGGWSQYFSNQPPNNVFKCQAGEIVTGFKCKGSYCYNVSLRCSTTTQVLSNCSWTEYFSDQPPAEKIWPDKVMAGMECSGDYCYNHKAYVCEATTPKATVAPPKGSWRVACSGGQGCANEFSESLNVGNISKESWNRETQAALSVAIEAGVNIVGASASTTVTGSTSFTNGNAGEIARKTDKNYSSKCSQQVDFKKYDIFAVWQWVVSSSIDRQPVDIKTCQITCSPDGIKPDWAPGSPQDIGSCLKERKSVSVSAPAVNNASVNSTDTDNGGDNEEIMNDADDEYTADKGDVTYEEYVTVEEYAEGGELVHTDDE